MTDPKFNIETERLSMRPFAPAHEDGLFEMNSDPEVMRYLGGVQTRAEVKDGIERVGARWKKHGFGWWSLFLKGSDKIIGAACLQHLDHQDGAPLEIGWRLKTAHQGHGYATEAGRAAMTYGFDIIGKDRLVSVANKENIASQHVMQRLGFSYVGIETHFDEVCAVYEKHRP